MTRRELYQAFQKEFPLESLKDMPLDKYTNLNKEDSFCYWLESRTFRMPQGQVSDIMMSEG